MELTNYKPDTWHSVKGYTALGQLGLLIAFLGAGFILAAVGQLIVGMAIVPPNTPMEKMPDAILKAMSESQNVGVMRASQVIGTFMLMFVPAALYSLISNGRNPFWLGFNKHFNSKQVLVAFALIFLSNIVAGTLADLSKYLVDFIPNLSAQAKEMENIYNDQVKAMSNLTGFGEYLIALIIIAFLPGVFEEMLFRGALQTILVKWWHRPLIAIIVTSVIFSFIHMSIYLFLSRILLGFVLGLIFFKSQNIWVNIIAHFLNNAIAVTQLYFMGMSKNVNKAEIKVTEMDPSLPWYVGVAALLALIWLFKIFDKMSAENRRRIEAQEQILRSKADLFKGIAHSPFN